MMPLDNLSPHGWIKYVYNYSPIAVQYWTKVSPRSANRPGLWQFASIHRQPLSLNRQSIVPQGTLRYVLYLVLSNNSVCFRTFLYLMFIITLAATVTREGLLNNFSITADISAVTVLLLAGLYVSSMSSCLGAMYGTPRVLQSIAKEKVIPGLAFLGHGVSFSQIIALCLYSIRNMKDKNVIFFNA